MELIENGEAWEMLVEVSSNLSNVLSRETKVSSDEQSVERNEQPVAARHPYVVVGCTDRQAAEMHVCVYQQYLCVCARLLWGM